MLKFQTDLYRFLRFRKSRGLTVIELIATMSSILMIAGAIYSMLYSATVMWQSSVTRTSNRQDMHTALRKVESELKNTDVSTITDMTTSSPPAFSFLSAYDENYNFTTDVNGNPVWKKYVIYYIPNGTTKLLRKEVYGDFSDPLSTADLTSNLDGSGKLISNQVTSMTLTEDAANKTATIGLTVQDTNKHGKIDRQNIEMTVSLRN